MPRIPLASLMEALGPEALGPENDDTDIMIFNGPVYIMTIDGEVNIVFGVFDPGNDGFSYEDLRRLILNQKIPNIWK